MWDAKEQLIDEVNDLSSGKSFWLAVHLELSIITPLFWLAVHLELSIVILLFWLAVHLELSIVTPQ